MASQYRMERDRGKESSQQLALLREKWPRAFPVKHQDIRPLAVGATGEIAATMGWSLPYTLGVLHNWKMAPICCQAVLCHGQRVALDGAPAEAVDAEAKGLAAKRLTPLPARKAAKRSAKVGRSLRQSRRRLRQRSKASACCTVTPGRIEPPREHAERGIR